MLGTIEIGAGFNQRGTRRRGYSIIHLQFSCHIFVTNEYIVSEIYQSFTSIIPTVLKVISQEPDRWVVNDARVTSCSDDFAHQECFKENAATGTVFIYDQFLWQKT